MAHNLAIDSKTGEASLYLLKQKAWHNLGQVVETAKNSDEVLKIAHLDYQVEKIPNFVNINDEFIPTSSFSLIRTDNHDILYSVAQSKYTVMQNIEAFKYMDSLVNAKSDIIYETAGALGKGETTFVTAKLPGYMRINGSDDIIEKFLVFTNSHAGGALSLYFTDVRVVCNNTLNASFKGATNRINLKHTANMSDRLKEGAKLLDLSYKYNAEFEEILNHLVKFQLNETVAKNIIHNTFLTAEEIEMMNTVDGISTRKRNTLDDVFRAIETAPGQDLHRGSALHLYNGVTSYFQNVKTYKSEDRKMAGINLGGDESIAAQRVFNQLLLLK